jgi:hypothetical protein
MTRRHLLLTAIFAAVLAVWSTHVQTGASAAGLPERLSDAAFWRIVETFSEPGGTFHSDNFISNEGRFQEVIPELVSRARPGGLYIGVGPEQNFTYMAALHPAMAFILDIRRGNLQEHLLYKALLELSEDRADFLSRLFSRTRPAGLSRTSPPEALFAAFDTVAPSETLYRANLGAVVDLLEKKHGFTLHPEDVTGIDYIYRTAFFSDGPELGYRLTGQGRTAMHPTYADLMTMDDGQGRQRAYLATEDHYAFIRGLQLKNLIVPVVGDFGGPKALGAIGAYAREARATVSAFYLSNVEQYLAQDGKTGAFCRNVAALPLDASSTFIRSHANGRGMRGPLGLGGRGMFWSDLGAMLNETRACAPVVG